MPDGAHVGQDAILRRVANPPSAAQQACGLAD
jgi:hypothetical protein